MNIAARLRRLHGVGPLPDCNGIEFTLAQLCALQARARELDLRLGPAPPVELSGGRRSRFRSRGLEYAESRAYLPGDDIRNMDWRVTARSGRPYTKLYQQDSERHTYVIVDLGANMFFGTRRAFKSVAAAQAAALVCWAAIRRGDWVGAIVFNGEQHLEVHARDGRQGVLQVLRALVTLGNRRPREPAPETNSLNDALQQMRCMARAGALLVVMSDFAALDSETERQLGWLRRHNEVFVTLIYDQLEETPPPPGRYAVTDGHEAAVIDTRPAGLRAAYRDHFERRRQRLRTLAARTGIRLTSLRTDEDAALASSSFHAYFAKAR